MLLLRSNFKDHVRIIFLLLHFQQKCNFTQSLCKISVLYLYCPSPCLWYAKSLSTSYLALQLVLLIMHCMFHPGVSMSPLSCRGQSVWIFLSDHYPCILLWLILKYICSYHLIIYHTYISVYWNRHIRTPCIIYCGKNSKQNIRYTR